MELTLEEFEFDKVMKDIVESLSPTVGDKDLELLTNVPEGITLYGDQRRLKQVLMNLVGNAAKFTPQGSVEVAARVLDGASLEISVTDTGIGIREEDLNKLFKPFQQIDSSLTRSYEGTGLGLYLCTKLLALMGGQVWAESEHGRGSTFTFVVPLRYGEE